MVKRIKYISALGLIICIFLSACGTSDVQSGDDSTSDNNIIYAPVDQATDDAANDTDDEPEDTDNADVIEPDDTHDTDDATDTADAADTTDEASDSEPALTPDDTDAEGDQTEETEPSDTPSADTGIIKLDEDFFAGEHAAGSIVSRQSEKIRLVVSYDCVMNDDGSVTVALEVGLESYDVNCGPRTNGGKIYINDTVHTFSTDEIVHEETGMIYIPLETYITQLDAGETSCAIGASWFFNGVYAGVKIDTLTVDAALDWSTNN